MKGYCHECKTSLAIHADGSIMCSCDGWDIDADVIRAAREEETES